MDYYEVDFTYESALETSVISDILAAELGEVGFESFSENEEGLQAFVAEETFSEAALQEKLSAFPIDGVKFHYQITFVKSKDWNEEWEKNYFKPIRIGNECIIRASFHPAEPGYTYNIIIDPKMAFGTGNHATTYLMIGHMLQLDLQGKELLDMGCGTAVLAILAQMRGAKRVVGIDIDEWAYNNALENIRLNHTEAIEIALGGAERIAEFGTFDVIFANINRNILLQDMSYYAKSLKAGGTLFMSGFYVEDLPAISRACEQNGMNVELYTEKENWCSVKVNKPL